MDPSKIGQGQSEEERKNWGEAEHSEERRELGRDGKMHTATITVKAFYNWNHKEPAENTWNFWVEILWKISVYLC